MGSRRSNSSDTFPEMEKGMLLRAQVFSVILGRNLVFQQFVKLDPALLE